MPYLVFTKKIRLWSEGGKVVSVTTQGYLHRRQKEHLHI